VPVSEEDLTRGALAGDNDCWSALIARHNHKVVVALLAHSVPLEQAKELAQETWLRLLQQQRAARLSELKLPGLAIVQARFLAASARRRGTKPAAAGHVDDESSAEPPVLATDPLALADEQLISHQQLHRVVSALQSCPPTARRVFQMVYENPELAYAEVAERLDLSTQRVKQIVCEVRKQLRAVLEDGEP
jgi:RNA polymerase sigma-70 factor (ECF subfamily)